MYFMKLTRCMLYGVVWWRHDAPKILVNNVGSNGFVPDGTKPLPKPIFTYGGTDLNTVDGHKNVFENNIFFYQTATFFQGLQS